MCNITYHITGSDVKMICGFASKHPIDDMIEGFSLQIAHLLQVIGLLDFFA